MSWTVAAYNVLADAYIRPAYYPHADPAWLQPARRRPALLRRIQELDVDLLCLQEVEEPVFELLQGALPDHVGCYARKSGGRPDGCATFTRLPLIDERVIRYADGHGESDSGHLALITTVEVDGGRLGLANSHIKWDPPGLPAAASWGHRQLSELLAALPPPGCAGHIVCGDFNATPDSALLAAARSAGLVDPFAAVSLPTCNANGDARRLDYLLCTPTLVASPRPVPSIGDDTPLPSSEHPSDHLPVVAELSWAT